MRLAFASLAALLLLAARPSRAADPYKPDPGPLAVSSLTADWIDPARPGGVVTVPVKLYFPKALADQKTPLPLIIFSHGLGGSREGYSMWASHWASHGYIVVLPTHIGSDTTAVLQSLRDPANALAAVVNVKTALRRVQDVGFCITQMEKADAGTLDDKPFAPFKGKIDVKHVGMAGHSFGAQTTLMIAGEVESQLANISFSDPRVTAAIAMSPQPAVRPDQKAAFAPIKIPLLHLTGTLDDSPPAVGNTKAAERRIPFDNETFPDTYLAIFTGATHMTFSARALNPPPQETAIFGLIKQSTTAFWDAYLKSDDKAKSWLQTDFAKVLSTAGTFEQKKK